MATVVMRTVTVHRPVEAVAAYLSDFTTSEVWDPHTVSCRRLDDGPLGPGSMFENVHRLAGRRLQLVYSVVGFEPGRCISLLGGNDRVRTCDEMYFAAPTPGSTTVTYTVHAELRGLARVGRGLLPLLLGRVADAGARQMRTTLLEAVSAAAV